jgi:hypothetical protein
VALQVQEQQEQNLHLLLTLQFMVLAVAPVLRPLLHTHLVLEQQD